MRTTIIDVKFDEESKPKIRIGLPCKEKPGNAENCRKIIKLLVEKNGILTIGHLGIVHGNGCAPNNNMSNCALFFCARF